MTNIVVPELGESVVEARVTRWLKHVGDRVEAGEPIVELETEKIDIEVNADRGGVVSSIKRKEGDDVKIGELLAVVDESASAAGNRAAATAPPPPATAVQPPAASPAASPAPPASAPTTTKPAAAPAA